MPTPRAHAAHVSRIEVVEMEAEQKRRLAAMALALCVDEEDYYPAPKRSCWVKDWMCRKELGLQNQLFKELVVSDPSEYRRLLRVSREQFAELLARMGPRIARKTTVMRQPIQPATKLQATLRYLASGPERVVPMVKAACVLHNYLGNDMSTFPDSGPEDSREQIFFGLRATRGRVNAFGARVREDMRDYFNGQGVVPWQRASAYVDE
nr:uncharacterized protein LOC129384276 [Dermacentor andersoni]